MAKPSRILISTIKRNQAFRGPAASEDQNAFQEEVIRDLVAIQQQYNTFVVPLTKTLPDGTNSLNAFQNGLDGKTIYVHFEAVNSGADTRYFNALKGRPNTIYEQFLSTYDYVDNCIDSIKQEIQNSLSSSASFTGINAQIENINAETDSLRGSIADLTSDIASLNTEIADTNSDLSMLDITVSSLTTEVSNLDTSVSDIDNEVNSIKTSPSFRRLEVAISPLLDNNEYLLIHDLEVYPHVQFINVDDGIVESIGRSDGIMIQHSDKNKFYIYNKTGMDISEALVILTW